MDKNEMKLQARKAVTFAKEHKLELAVTGVAALWVYGIYKVTRTYPKVDLDKTEELIKWTETGLLLDGVSIIIPKSENWYIVKDITVDMGDIVGEIVNGDYSAVTNL